MFLTASKWGFGPCLPLYLVLTTCDRISQSGRKWNVHVVCAQLSMHLLMYIRGRIKRSEWRQSPVDWTASCCRYSFLTISWLYCQFIIEFEPIYLLIIFIFHPSLVTERGKRVCWSKHTEVSKAPASTSTAPPLKFMWPHSLRWGGKRRRQRPRYHQFLRYTHQCA